MYSGENRHQAKLLTYIPPVRQRHLGSYKRVLLLLYIVKSCMIEICNSLDCKMKLKRLLVLSSISNKRYIQRHLRCYIKLLNTYIYSFSQNNIELWPLSIPINPNYNYRIKNYIYLIFKKVLIILVLLYRRWFFFLILANISLFKNSQNLLYLK